MNDENSVFKEYVGQYDGVTMSGIPRDYFFSEKRKPKKRKRKPRSKLIREEKIYKD